MSTPSRIQYVVSALRPVSANAAAKLLIIKDQVTPLPPAGLSVVTGCVFEGDVTINEYVTARVSRIINKGGPILDGARVELLFWGDFWRTTIGTQTVDLLVQAVNDIVASPYLSELQQYGIHSISLGTPMIVLSPGAPTPTYSGFDVGRMVWGLIDDGRFPEGDARIFAVFAPQGTMYNDPAAGGAHNAMPDTDYLEDIGDVLTLQGLDLARSAWVNFADIGSMTSVFTHELVESLTNPDPLINDAILTDSPQGAGEIADACLNQIGSAGGQVVAAYYSDRLKKCVVPTEVLHRSVSLSTSVHYGPLMPAMRGTTATDRPSRCYRGEYSWNLYRRDCTLTVTADVSTFIRPAVSWVVNGTPLNAAGVTTIQADVTAMADPLSTITSVPASTATITCTPSPDPFTLTIDNNAQGQCDLYVRCIVSEDPLSNVCTDQKWERQIGMTLTGLLRQMDARWHADNASCTQWLQRFGHEILQREVIPRIPLGDPPPPWERSELVGVEQSVANEVDTLSMLAHFIARADPAAATELRQAAALTLANAFVAEARAPAVT